MEEQLDAGALWVINPHCFLTSTQNNFEIGVVPIYMW